MSKILYDEIMKNIDEDKYHIYFEGDKEILLEDLEYLWIKDKLTDEEYESIIDYVEVKTDGVTDCIWEDMIKCNPDLID